MFAGREFASSDNSCVHDPAAVDIRKPTPRVAGCVRTRSRLQRALKCINIGDVLRTHHVSSFIRSISVVPSRGGFVGGVNCRGIRWRVGCHLGVDGGLHGVGPGISQNDACQASFICSSRLLERIHRRSGRPRSGTGSRSCICGSADRLHGPHTARPPWYDLAWRAVAALERIVIDESLLHGTQRRRRLATSPQWS